MVPTQFQVHHVQFRFQIGFSKKTPYTNTGVDARHVNLAVERVNLVPKLLDACGRCKVARTAMTSTPLCRSSAAAMSSCSLAELTMRSYPRVASSSASDLPMPLDAPVINARLFDITTNLPCFILGTDLRVFPTPLSAPIRIATRPLASQIRHTSFRRDSHMNHAREPSRAGRCEMEVGPNLRGSFEHRYTSLRAGIPNYAH